MFPGNPAIRDIREPDIREWSVIAGIDGWEVHPPAVGPAGPVYLTRWRDTADALALYLNVEYADYGHGDPAPDVADFPVRVQGE